MKIIGILILWTFMGGLISAVFTGSNDTTMSRHKWTLGDWGEFIFTVICLLPLVIVVVPILLIQELWINRHVTEEREDILDDTFIERK